jgi:hypothetical protein
MARSTPESPGIITSDSSKSGAAVRAADNASSGSVKDLAAKPLPCRIVARVSEMIFSSSTTNTLGRFVVKRLGPLSYRLRQPNGSVQTNEGPKNGRQATHQLLLTSDYASERHSVRYPTMPSSTSKRTCARLRENTDASFLDAAVVNTFSLPGCAGSSLPQ